MRREAGEGGETCGSPWLVGGSLWRGAHPGYWRRGPLFGCSTRGLFSRFHVFSLLTPPVLLLENLVDDVVVLFTRRGWFAQPRIRLVSPTTALGFSAIPSGWL